VADHDAAAAPERDYARLLSLASHELRTPLSVVGGYLRMLQRDTDHPIGDRHRKIVEEADKACLRMTALLSELSDLAKLDDRGAALSYESFDLIAVVQKVAAEADEAADRGVRLSLRGDSQAAPLHGDRMRLHTAFAALFRAVLREQRDSTLVVADCRLTRRGTRRSALIVVAREDQLESALSAAPAVFDETRGGLGLTLPIARRVVERHGGRVWSPAGEDGAAAARGAVVVAIPLTE
jgi:signal transduction histidine kinase